MRPGWLRAVRLIGPLLTLLLAAAACGDGESGDDIFVTGSSTVEPISARVAELMGDNTDADVAVTVEGPGTGDGFEIFCNGEADISDASRPIKPEEVEDCEAAGVDFIELKVAFDGLSVVTNPANDAVECLSFADLYALAGPEAEGFDTWQDAEALAHELGSDTDLPDASLDITAPGEESGTYDSFVELALLDIAEQRAEEGEIDEGEVETTRPDYTSQSEDSAIIQGIRGSDSSFGWVGFAFAQQAGDAVKELEVDGGDGCVAPSAETIADGSYPLSRPLFVYVNAAEADPGGAVAAYVDYYLGDGIAAVEDVGYVPLPDDELAETRHVWDTRTTGTTEG